MINENNTYELFFVYNVGDKVICDPINEEDKKNINPDNIIEKLFEFVIDTGIILF